MKRKSNLYQEIISIENLLLAESKARKGKSNRTCVKKYDEDSESNILELHKQLKNKTYTTSKYTTFKIKDPKERIVYELPYYPDRIVQHAAMNILEPYFTKTFTANTYSCIKGRGVHAAVEAVKKMLKNKEQTKYCLKIDIRKFYPSVDNEILKQLLRRKFKDKDLLWLLSDIIDSSVGLPIGNYSSQPFGNFYLTYFDHWVKEKQNVCNYVKYADDMVFFSDSKEFLHNLLANTKAYLKENLKLELKSNYQIFPVESRGVDFLGYVFFHTHTKVRKRIKKKFARVVRYNPNKKSIDSYLGWLKHGNCVNLKNKILYAGNPN